jgi:GxxExxY protein
MTENDISKHIVEAAIEVHRTLGGPGLLESVYEEALVWELQQRGLEVQRQVSLPIPYKGHILASPLRIDLIVSGLVIVECKAVTHAVQRHLRGANADLLAVDWIEAWHGDQLWGAGRQEWHSSSGERVMKENQRKDAETQRRRDAKKRSKDSLRLRVLAPLRSMNPTSNRLPWTGSLGGDLVRVLDFDNPENNDFLAVNQFTVVEDRHERRPDVVLFVNGLPLAVMELKNAADEDATIWSAFNQLQTYKQQIPSLFTFNEALMISDGVEARIGTISADRERFAPWRTIAGEDLAPASMPELQVVLEGAFEKTRFLQLVRHFIVFEPTTNDPQTGVRGSKMTHSEPTTPVVGSGFIKKMAGYHQFHAVNLALAATLKATGAGGDRRVGVVWHTQGSGKSLTMAFYAGRVILEPAMKNPTVVVITDRNDLDDQLFGTFDRRSPEEIEHAIRQIVSRAVASDEVIDIFAAAGWKKPDISILSDEFLAEVRGLPQRNLAVEMLRKLLESEIKTRRRKNVIQARSFAEMLENAIRRYQNRAIETAHVIEELIGLAKEMREARQRGEQLGLTEDEIAFYDALEVNDSAVESAWRANLEDDCARVGQSCTEQPDHRLDGSRERAGQSAGHHQADSP